MIRVLLVDDQNLIREGLRALLNQEQDLQVVGDADTGQSAIRQVEKLHPDIVLIDPCCAKAEGIAATETICQRFPESQVLILTDLDDQESVTTAFKVGVKGYLLKDLCPDELVNAVRSVHKGYTQLSPGILPKILDGIFNKSASLPPSDVNDSRSNVVPFDPASRRSTPLPPGFTKLTTRERQVLRLIAGGSSNREISRSLEISEGTVKNHVASILGRLNLRDRTQAAIVANSVMPIL
ncbi:MAG: response regulator transcription factor [Phormidesmis sp. CAN_BIN36]|nr:response regulator transcription factor [Phormidesmis sp. CAN_BIN36]